jgi:hypothetical protein
LDDDEYDHRSCTYDDYSTASDDDDDDDTAAYDDESVL